MILLISADLYPFIFLLLFLSTTAQQKPVISTLTRLFNETSEALGGSRANPAKKREIEDNSRKLGALFAKLNSGDISKNAAEKLVQLCQALDKGDFGTALQIQVDEESISTVFFLYQRQSMRLYICIYMVMISYRCFSQQVIGMNAIFGCRLSKE